MISIIIPYYNRKKILYNTLKSIQYFKTEIDMECLIIDDGSSDGQKVYEYEELFRDLNLRVCSARPCNSPWRSPAIAYNVGFNEIKGDIVVLNSCDCLHIGNILGYAEELPENTYISFSTLAVNDDLTSFWDNIDWTNEEMLSIILSRLNNYRDGWWRSHRTNKTFIPFCAVMSRNTIESLNGYDERFTDGIGYDDYDFTDRITNLGLNMQLIDDPFCVHQHHELVQYTNSTNKDFLDHLVATEPDRVKAPDNKIYVR